MSATNCQPECPICMDTIEINKNCVTTECGHCFHASCLMINISHNGFGCPYCRTVMAEESEDSEEEVSEIGSDETLDQDEMFSEYALRGLRLFTNNLNGVDHDEEDIVIEQYYESETEQISKPSAAFIVKKLTEQGITMEYMVKAMLLQQDEYEEEEEEYERIDEDLFEKLRIIISNYSEEEAITEAVVEEPKEPAPANVTERRRIMTHI